MISDPFKVYSSSDCENGESDRWIVNPVSMQVTIDEWFPVIEKSSNLYLELENQIDL